MFYNIGPRACQERADYVALLLTHPEIDINLVNDWHLP